LSGIPQDAKHLFYLLDKSKTRIDVLEIDKQFYIEQLQRVLNGETVTQYPIIEQLAYKEWTPDKGAVLQKLAPEFEITNITPSLWRRVREIWNNSFTH
jgi:hypothetical protein